MTTREDEGGRQPLAKRLSGCLATLGLMGLCAGAAAWAVRGSFAALVWIPAAAGAALLAAAAAIQPKAVIRALAQRRFALGANTAVVLILFAALLVMVNYVAARRHWRLDLTRAKVHSLSPQTQNILRGLKKKATVIGFYSRRPAMTGDYASMKDLLDEYKYSSQKLEVRIVDVDREPAVAEEFGVTIVPTVVVRSGLRKEELYTTEEQDLTSAILKVSRKGKKQIYFLVGHGEHDPSAYGDDSYSMVREALGDLNYEVKTLNLAAEGKVPRDCAALVVGGPKQPLLEREETVLGDYLRRGGKALLLIDPGPSPDLSSITRSWGIESERGTVVEPSLNIFGDAASVAVQKFEDHDVVRPFTRGRTFLTFFVMARALKKTAETPRDMSVSELFKTSPESWLESKFLGTVRHDVGEERGPFLLGAAVAPTLTGEAAKRKPRIVVIGDSDFASDEYVRNAGNGSLFLNAVNWLAQEEELISIPPRREEAPPIILTSDQQRKVKLLTIFSMPVLVLIAGIWVWSRRR